MRLSRKLMSNKSPCIYVIHVFQYICIMKCVIKVFMSSDMFLEKSLKIPYPDSNVHGANMGPTWVLSAPDGPHVGLHELCYQGSFDQSESAGIMALAFLPNLMTWYGLQTCHSMAGSDLFNSMVPGRSGGCFTNPCELSKIISQNIQCQKSHLWWEFQGNFILLSSKLQWSNYYEILHMAGQLCCHGMCKIL